MSILDLILPKRSLQDSKVLQGRTDRHSHILPGVDDGIVTLDDALAVLAYEESLGITDVWCTPHIMEDVANTTDALRQRFAELQAAYTGGITLHLAAEYMLDNLFAERFEARDLLMMDDDTILVETSTWNPPPGFETMLQDILSAGFRPLLAHPERYRYLDESAYGRLYAMGVRFQMNIGSITGYYGQTAQKKARYLLAKGWYTHIGTDCHRLKTLQDQMTRKALTKKDISSISTNRS